MLAIRSPDPTRPMITNVSFTLNGKPQVAATDDRRTLLESIIEPSRVVSETYRSVTIAMKSGAIVDGRIVGEDVNNVVLAINPVDPDQRRRLAKTDIAEQRVSEVSPMPAGLLNTLTRDEILDLLAWVESGGDPRHNNFKQPQRK